MVICIKPNELQIMNTIKLKPNLPSKLVTGISKTTTLGESILNGIIGDYLHHTSNGLSIDMQFFRNGQPLHLGKEKLKQYDSNLSPKICILIHGLLNNETTWNFADLDDVNYGTLLQNDFNYTPFYLRYNTGMHISENGKLLSQLMETLINEYPIEVEEILIIAHSMGGLVARSACHYAPVQGEAWINKISKLIFIGTPHLGAPLEKFGNVVTYLLKKIPVSYTRVSGDIINLRSSGIKDLRFGYLTDDDWKSHHPDQLLKNNKSTVPLLKHADYFLITGTVSEKSESIANQWFGDALVLKASATGISKNKHHIPFNLKNHKEFTGIVHQKLVNQSVVYEQIRSWVSKRKKLLKPDPTAEFRFMRSKKEDYFLKINKDKKSKLDGLKILSADVFTESITKLEELNRSRLAYKILNHIPVLNVFSREIENTQVQVVSKILKGIKSIVK